MISHSWLMVVLLALPGADDVPRPAEEGASSAREAESQFNSLREARDEVSRVLQATNRASGVDLKEATPMVVSTYDRLGRTEKVPLAERRKLQARLQTRLTDQAKILRRQEQQRTPALSGDVRENAQELLNLIQITVEPESWSVNGGRGSIVFFPYP